MYFMGIVSIIGAILGGLTLLVGFIGAQSAPQEAAAAALAVALAVIPYVIFRVIQLTQQKNEIESIKATLEATRREASNARG